MTQSTPSFVEFFSALHDGRQPFPWQVRLAEQVLDSGWPALLDLPTGVGKTSALDIALYTLALRPDVLPRRTLLVVDRRVVVEQGAVHARRILARMQAATTGPVRAVADALRQLCDAEANAAPFAVAELRGGMPRDNDWAHRPDMAVLGVSTVDQVGSRLLFRGYGISPRSASIHAGLLGNDTLILLDEVHLSEPFAQTLKGITVLQEANASAPLPRRLQIVRMSATVDASGEVPFRLAHDDHEHPVLARRLAARKIAGLSVVTVNGKDEERKREMLANELARIAQEKLSGMATVLGVVVNRVDTARLVHRRLLNQGVPSVLVTGRMRPLEREVFVRDTLFPRAGVGRSRAEATPLVVVATQCIEAGADLDFDALITECASLDALRQRFGRVDRLGELGESASVIVCRSDQAEDSSDDPVYGAALSATWQRLQAVAVNAEVDMGNAGQYRITPRGEQWSALMAPRADAPVLLPMHLDVWSQTSERLSFDPDVAAWLHGPQQESADVQVVWRAGISLEIAKGDHSQPERVIDQVRDRVIAWLSACRPSALEAVSLPVGTVRRWLQQTAPSSDGLSDTVATALDSDVERPRRDAGDAQEIVGWRWDGEDSQAITAREIRPADIIVVDASRGGLLAGSFDPDSYEPVTDLGDLAQLRGRGIGSLRLVPEAMRAWGFLPELASELSSRLNWAEEESEPERRAIVRETLALLPTAVGAHAVARDDDLARLREALLRGSMRRGAGVIRCHGRVVLEGVASGNRSSSEIVQRAVTEDELSGFERADATLLAHSEQVEALVRSFARHLGLPDAIVHDLALAGWLHDIGKADPRFQQWLLGGSEVALAMLREPLAKSAVGVSNPAAVRAARVRAGYPEGYRHEALSVAMATSAEPLLADANDRDLVLHLIASHHGGARPFVPVAVDVDPVDVTLQHGAYSLRANTGHGLARLDSGVADRFWRLTERYGWWGVAWCEALLRLADHRASELITEEAP